MTKFIESLVPISHCNLRCEYCYVIQGGYRDSVRPAFRRTPEEIGRAFKPARWGADYLFVNFCGVGETFLCKEIPDIVTQILLQGRKNIVLITNNGTITPAIERLINLPDDLASRLIFGVSLHYKELKKRKLLKVFAKNVKKIAASKASFHVSFNLYEGYMDCLDEIKSYCLDNFGALPQVAIMRDQRSGMKLYDPIDLAEYKRRGAEFHSPRFEVECDNFLVNRRKYFCHAGQTSWFLDLATGNLAHCYNAHVWLTLGLIPHATEVRYGDIRNRVRSDGREWLNPKLKEFFSTKLSDNNRLLSDAKKLQYMIMNRLGL